MSQAKAPKCDGADPAELISRDWAHRARPPVANPMLALLGGG